MKYSDLVALQAATPRLMRKPAAEAYLGAPELLDRLLRGGWLKPTVAAHRMTLYDQHKLDDCVDRLNDGEFPDELAA